LCGKRKTQMRKTRLRKTHSSNSSRRVMFPFGTDWVTSADKTTIVRKKSVVASSRSTLISCSNALWSKENSVIRKGRGLRWFLAAMGVFSLSPADAAAQDTQPNILFIMGDDIGMWNIGAYHRGMMAGRTPNLDKMAKEGMLFTDYYAEASCTA